MIEWLFILVRFLHGLRADGSARAVSEMGSTGNRRAGRFRWIFSCRDGVRSRLSVATSRSPRARPAFSRSGGAVCAASCVQLFGDSCVRCRSRLLRRAAAAAEGAWLTRISRGNHVTALPIAPAVILPRCWPSVLATFTLMRLSTTCGVEMPNRKPRKSSAGPSRTWRTAAARPSWRSRNRRSRPRPKAKRSCAACAASSTSANASSTSARTPWKSRPSSFASRRRSSRARSAS